MLFYIDSHTLIYNAWHFIPVGYTGTRCERNINECNSQPCQNGAQCIDGINAYVCVCPDGYQGAHCEMDINECASSPCTNGGTCVDSVNRFACVCPDG